MIGVSGIGFAVGIADKAVVLVVAVVVAIQELRKALLARNKVMGGRQANRDFQGALAGDTIKVTLGNNAERLAQVGEQGIADPAGNLQAGLGLAVGSAGITSALVPTGQSVVAHTIAVDTCMGNYYPKPPIGASQ